MPLIEVEGLTKTFGSGDNAVHAVNGVSFEISEGETLGLIGESGSGKSTVGRLVLRLLDASSGSVRFDGHDVFDLDSKRLRPLRSRMQIVFQEPYESLNPRLPIARIVGEPLEIHERSLSSREMRARVDGALEHVGLDASFRDRYPRALSGGQQQRVGIARAIVTEPRFVVLDEPTSSLDLSVRAQILQLLNELQDRLGLAYLFISHDLATVRYISDRVAVMYLGQFAEVGTAEQIAAQPIHPYTSALLSASLSADPTVQYPQQELRGEIPSPRNLPKGCFLYSRCPIRIEECAQEPIGLEARPDGRHVRCIRADHIEERFSALYGGGGEAPPDHIDQN